VSFGKVLFNYHEYVHIHLVEVPEYIHIHLVEVHEYIHIHLVEMCVSLSV